ncbi:OLC1v1038207C1 [Oldenlandia corymbosa var. corymbosa]|uniref:OLC1v1038207C1 n=1 Tax=Oldenlandia corymbosa var. corymbosa TaxID=529605 RepID=A0AAV1D2C0_OLDCO|nr:OLC1v1038207C1 [Oldenlandia corymbosa var. corymbosa]
MENSIQIGLDDLEAITREFPKWQRDGVRNVKCSLGLMRMLFQWRKIGGEDAGSESALCTVEETVLKCSLEIRFLYLKLKEPSNDHVTSDQEWCRFFKFLHEIVESIWQGMEETFDIVSDVVRKRKTSSSSHLEMEELLDIIEFLGGSYDDEIAVNEALELSQSSIHHLTPQSNALESSVAFVGSLRS